MSAYERVVSFRFRVNSHEHGITVESGTQENPEKLYVEDLRKNGQEDCHAWGILERGVNGWTWEDETFTDYGDADPAEILAYINANPPIFVDSVSSPIPLNNDASGTPDIARALHRVVRAMHDGNCPKCGILTDSANMRSEHHPWDWVCPNPDCKFKIASYDAIAAMQAFRPFMEANVAVFEEWRKNR